MIGKLIDLCTALRFEGLPVALSESIEAAAVLSEYASPSPAHKHSIRLILISCLIKNERDIQVFDKQFERWWSRWFETGEIVVSLPALKLSLFESILKGDRESIDQLIQLAVGNVRNSMLSGSGGGSSGGQGGEGEYAEYGGPLRQWRMNRIVYERVKDLLQLEQMQHELEHRPDMGLWQRIQAENAINRAESSLRKSAFTDEYSSIRRNLRRPKETEEDLSEVNISRATFTQLQKMQELVPEIVRRLAHRRKFVEDGHRGILQYRKTMRSSLSHGGVPVDIVFKRKAPRRERIAILCDLSGSVEWFSVFALQLANCFSRQFAGVRCYGFISDIDDMTRFVSRSDFPRSLRGIYRECTFVSGTDNSDYGQVFRQFVRKHLGDLGRSTSVIIIGDARTNGRDPGLHAFKTIQSWVKEVHWLNPEPKGSWAYGDSVMEQYAELCDSAHHVSTINDLAAFLVTLRGY